MEEMNSQLNQGKEIYDKIIIPENLNKMVQDTIASVDKKAVLKKTRSKRIIQFAKSAGTLAATFIILTTIGLNTSQTFAEALSDVPIIGSLSKVLTIRSYTEQEENTTISVKVPEVQPNTQDAAGAPEVMRSSAEEGFAVESYEESNSASKEQAFLGDINAEIDKIVQNYIENAKKEMEEYKEAFLDTGGTLEEWNERSLNVDVTYDVKYQVGSYLSLVLYNSQSWVSYTEERIYYNLDLANNRTITLEDLLGENYIEIANESIKAQMADRVANQGAIYWGMDEETAFEDPFTTIDPSAQFYLNAKGNPVICFPKYEIGPGYLGIQEFEIPIGE